MNPTPHNGHRRNGDGHEPGNVVSPAGTRVVSSTCAYPLPPRGEGADSGGADR